MATKFNSKRFMRDLEREIAKRVQKDIQQHPTKVLDGYVGKRVNAECSCGGTEAEVLPRGRERCISCGTVSVPTLNLDWR